VNKPFHVVECDQGTDDWLQARCGLLTGSRAPDMLKTLKGKGEAASRRDLRLALVCERLTGRPTESGYVSADMKRGRELEAAAVRAYEARMGVFVKRVGFLRHPTLLAGCSPDGYVGDYKVIVECKAPRSATHLGYLRSGKRIPDEYYGQCLHNCWISGAEFCDFFSFDPRFPLELQMYHVRYAPSEFERMTYQRTVETFLAEVDQELEDVQALVTAAA
jgi:hypothetical protein